MKRFVEIDTPLKPDTLLFYKMRAKEELSRLSEYELDLLSSDRAIKLDDVLGKTVNVKLELADDKVRSFSGYVTRIALVGMHGRYYAYRATVRPWLWFLTRTTNCRIFQEKSAPDILKEVFAKHPDIADVKFELTESYSPWDYCVQYRETDFNFVSRLMEHEGMYYFFTHSEGRHTLVIADSYSAHAVANGGEIPFIEPEKLVRAERDHVSEWSYTHELRSGKYALTDYDFEKPSVDLQVKSQFKRENALADYEKFEYPGDYLERGDGEKYVRTRMEEEQAKFERVQAATNVRALATGYLFTLTDHPRDDQNTEYLVVSAEYELKSTEYDATEGTGADYKCRFSALNSHQPFRAERLTPKPVVHGPQTAITVGPSGETIHTDKFGRVKVQFHWDRYGKKDDKSSCWIRVSQNWGGKGWGGMFIPHTGQEVIVQFLEGDPDMPLITGRVYNAENMPPVALPAGKTQSIIRDHGSNEIIMEGEAGKQRITMYSPFAETKFSMGAPNSPGEGFYGWTNAKWEFFNGSDYEWKIMGNSTTQVFGFYLQHVVGVQEETCLGAKTEHVVGVHVNVDAAGVFTNAAPFIVDLAAGWKHERAPKIIEYGGNHLEKEDQDWRQINSAIERYGDKLARDINTEITSVKTRVDKINTWQVKVAGTTNQNFIDLIQQITDLKQKVGAITTVVEGQYKLSAGNIDLKADGTVKVIADHAEFTGQVLVEKDFAVHGNAQFANVLKVCK